MLDWYVKNHVKYSLYFTGRAALQKRIMALLRKIDSSTPGTSQVRYSFSSIALDKALFFFSTKKYLYFSYFSMKTYVVGTH